MATDNPFDKQKLIEALRAQGVSDKEIEKLVGGPIPKVTPNNNAKKNAEYKKKHAWKYDNKHGMPVRREDEEPDYEPIEELRNGQTKKKPKKPRIGKKKPKPRPKRFDWTATTEERLRNLYEAGYSINDIAQELGTTVDAITSKITRLKAAGWKAQVGTTHNPLPKNPKAPKGKFGEKLGPESRRILYDILAKNFGAAGRYFGKKWGLADDKAMHARSSGKGGSDPEVIAAVIRGNKATMEALAKLDTAFKRSNNMLTKRIAKATDNITDALSNTTTLVSKMSHGQAGGVAGGGGPQQGVLGGNGGNVIGGLIGLIGGGILASMMSGQSHASITYGGNDDADVNDTDDQRPEPNKPPEVPDLLEIKSRDMSFEADDIVFEADEFKFNGILGGAVTGQAGPAGGGIKKPYKGFFNELADKIFGTGGGDGQGGYGDNSSAGGAGGAGGGGGGGGGGRSGGGGSSGGGSDATAAGKPGTFQQRWNDTAGQLDNSKTLAEQRAKLVKEAESNPELLDKIMRIAANEQGSNPEGVQQVMESMMNRALVRGTSLAAQARWYESEGGYYQQGNMGRGALENAKHRAILEKAWRNAANGSNLANYATDNSSGSLAAREKATGKFRMRNETNGETFFAPGSAEPGLAKKWDDWHSAIERAEAARKQNDALAKGLADKAKNLSPNGSSQSDSKNNPDDPRLNGIHIRPNPDATPAPPPSMKDMESDTDAWMKKLGPSPEPTEPDTGKKLNQMQNDLDDSAPSFNDRFKGDGGGSSKRSDSTDPVNNDSFQTTLLQTEGPNHFSDYPGFENDTNSYGVV